MADLDATAAEVLVRAVLEAARAWAAIDEVADSTAAVAAEDALYEAVLAYEAALVASAGAPAAEEPAP